MKEVVQWGSIQWAIINFARCSQFTGFYDTAGTPDLSQSPSLGLLLFLANKFNDEFNDLSTWDVSAVVGFRGTFRSQTSFNGDLSSWDVSSAIDFIGTFQDNPIFDSDISSWNTSSATSMKGMFDNSALNQDISSWDVSSVVDMTYMFLDNDNFYQNISSWDVSSVTLYADMFKGSIMTTDLIPLAWQGDTTAIYTLGFPTPPLPPHSPAPPSPPPPASPPPPSDSFITEWEIDHTSSDHNEAGFRIVGSNLDFSIDWGDGTSSSHNSSNLAKNDLVHTYSSSGKFNVSYSGTITQIYGCPWAPNTLKEVVQWGSIQWTFLSFARCYQFTGFYDTAGTPDLSQSPSLNLLLERSNQFNDDLSTWDVSAVLRFRGTFKRHLKKQIQV